jgi:hypothetical protein
VSARPNLVVHKQPEVRAAIEAAGAQLRFLPPHSPDFNPIEMAFAKLIAFLGLLAPVHLMTSSTWSRRRSVSSCPMNARTTSATPDRASPNRCEKRSKV